MDVYKKPFAKNQLEEISQKCLSGSKTSDPIAGGRITQGKTLRKKLSGGTRKRGEVTRKEGRRGGERSVSIDQFVVWRCRRRRTRRLRAASAAAVWPPLPFLLTANKCRRHSSSCSSPPQPATTLFDSHPTTTTTGRGRGRGRRRKDHVTNTRRGKMKKGNSHGGRGRKRDPFSSIGSRGK